MSGEERGGLPLGADGVTSTDVEEKAEPLCSYFVPESLRGSRLRRARKLRAT